MTINKVEMKVIINADDLGLSYNTNKAIEKAIIEKRISSSSILANGMAFEDAVNIAKRFPNISFGVHLNIIEFKPLTNTHLFEKYSITDGNGNFIEEAVFMVKKYTQELKEAIYQEWMEQINKIKKTGISISHIDSHQHTHGIYALKDVLIRVIQDSGIKKVRRKLQISMLTMLLNSNSTYIATLDKSGVVKKKKKGFVLRRINQVINTFKNYIWIKQLKKHAILTENFMSYGNYIHLYRSYYKWLNLKTIELMCHPGHKAYTTETKSLMTNELSKLKHFSLISYNEL